MKKFFAILLLLSLLLSGCSSAKTPEKTRGPCRYDNDVVLYKDRYFYCCYAQKGRIFSASVRSNEEPECILKNAFHVCLNDSVLFAQTKTALMAMDLEAAEPKWNTLFSHADGIGFDKNALIALEDRILWFGNIGTEMEYTKNRPCYLLIDPKTLSARAYYPDVPWIWIHQAALCGETLYYLRDDPEKLSDVLFAKANIHEKKEEIIRTFSYDTLTMQAKENYVLLNADQAGSFLYDAHGNPAALPEPLQNTTFFHFYNDHILYSIIPAGEGDQQIFYAYDLTARKEIDSASIGLHYRADTYYECLDNGNVIVAIPGRRDENVTFCVNGEEKSFDLSRFQVNLGMPHGIKTNSSGAAMSCFGRVLSICWEDGAIRCWKHPTDP